MKLAPNRCWTDIETDGLLHELEQMYCAVILDREDEAHKFRSVHGYLNKLIEFDEIVFHNGIGFDYWALVKLVGHEIPWLKERMTDTLVESRLIFSDMFDVDFAKSRKYGAAYPLPKHMFGRHSLKSWGLRLGCMKGDFDPKDYTNPETGKPHTWKTVGFSQDMLDYNVQDCVVTKKVDELMRRQNYSKQAIKLEHDIAWLMMKQEMNGFYFDEQSAADLYAELCGKRAKLEYDLVESFGWWYEANGQTKPKRTIDYKDVMRPDLTEGAPYTKVKIVEFNPASRHHIARCFKRWYGWEPKDFTDKGEPKVDAEVLAKLPYKEALPLKDYFDYNKMIGMLGDGKNAWLKLVKNGRIHGSINPNGAGTGRATHSKPNVAQVPKGNEGTYGHRCRQLFTVPPTWVLLGTDASGLELRGLGNRLAPFDGGAYGDLVVNGDIHWHNTLALSLVPPGTVRDKHNPDHEDARNVSKRWIYAL